jgi:hypothetical protein
MNQYLRPMLSSATMSEMLVDSSYDQLDDSTSVQNIDVALHPGVFQVSYLYPQRKRMTKMME